MTLAKRLDKLEPSMRERWEVSWKAAITPPEYDHYHYAAQRARARFAEMTEDEIKQFDERFRAELEANYPALCAWDDNNFRAWIEMFDKWLATAGFDWAKPDLSLWPHHAPEPPEIPPEVVSELEQAASKRGELTDVFAHSLLDIATAIGVRDAGNVPTR